MAKKFELADYFIFLIILLNTYVLTIIKGFNFAFSVVHYLQIFFFFAFVVFRINFSEILKYSFPKINVLFFELYLVFAAFLISSFIVNISYNVNLESILKLTTYPLIFFLFFFFFPKKIYKSDYLFEIFLQYILIIGFVHGIYTIMAQVFNLNSGSMYSTFTIGLFGHPNTVSFIYTILIPIAIYKYFAKKIKLTLLILIISVFIYCLLFTFSRSGYLSFFIVVLMFSYSKSKMAFIFATIISAFLIIFIFAEFALSKTDSSLARILLYATAINMTIADLQHFLWGYGVTNAIEVFLNEKILLGSFEAVISPHNFILLLSIQFGVLVPFLFLIFVIHHYYKVIKLRKLKFLEEKSLKVRLSIIITVSILIQNILEDVVAHPEFFVMPFFLIFLGYLYNYINNYKIIQSEACI